MVRVGEDAVNKVRTWGMDLVFGDFGGVLEERFGFSAEKISFPTFMAGAVCPGPRRIGNR